MKLSGLFFVGAFVLGVIATVLLFTGSDGLWLLAAATSAIALGLALEGR